jgi:hypothetical protein
MIAQENAARQLMLENGERLLSEVFEDSNLKLAFQEEVAAEVAEETRSEVQEECEADAEREIEEQTALIKADARREVMKELRDAGCECAA